MLEEEGLVGSELNVTAPSVTILPEGSIIGNMSHTLNDLQSYLVNFNKEIEGAGDGGAVFQTSMNRIMASGGTPIFATGV